MVGLLVWRRRDGLPRLGWDAAHVVLVHLSRGSSTRALGAYRSGRSCAGPPPKAQELDRAPSRVALEPLAPAGEPSRRVALEPLAPAGEVRGGFPPRPARTRPWGKKGCVENGAGRVELACRVVLWCVYISVFHLT